MTTPFHNLLTETENLLAESTNPLADLCDLLRNNVPHYNWVGFYFMNDENQMLEIGPYSGAETEHTRIPYGRGICGQVAESGETFLVQDVNAESNYLSCSIETKAEIVAPIYKGEKLVAQLDIDSHYLNAFTEDDQRFLESVCQKVANIL